MKVILLQDVPGTGRRGEVKEVADGFARNFLLPKNLVKNATVATLRELEIQTANRNKQMERELKENQQLATKLDGAEFEVQEKVSKAGRLFAAVDGKKIAALVNARLKAAIDPKQVKLKAPIKEAGEHRVMIGFGHGLEAEIKLTVSKK